ncbi:MAG: hypothetical protein AABW81_04695 [Nanoarchaeota archaeon]
MIKIFFAIFFAIFFFSGASALTNESLSVKSDLDNLLLDIGSMKEKNIPVTRISESFQEVLQLYNGQIALENLGHKSDYNLINKRIEEINKIKKNAIKANDELSIFLDFYKEHEKTSNLSSMDSLYKDILNSFSEERFEDTLSLIDNGYAKISEIQISQTTVNLFYQTTSNTIKKFFKENWLKIIIILGIVLTLLFLFRKAIMKIRIKSKLRDLKLQKETLNSLIKGLQYRYFKKQDIPEVEFHSKMVKFKEMILDIDRQIPLLSEEMMKVEGKTTDFTKDKITIGFTKKPEKKQDLEKKRK